MEYGVCLSIAASSSGSAANYYWTATPSSATGCRHPRVDASISTWMAPGHLHGDSVRSPPGIHYWMRVRPRCGCSGRARPRDRSATARPFALGSTSSRPASPGRGLPRRQRRRVTRRSGRVGEARPRRFPIAFRAEQLHGLEPLLPLRIVTVAYADEAVTVLGEELLRALLARLEMQPYSRSGRLGRGPGWRGAGGGAGGRDR